MLLLLIRNTDEFIIKNNVMASIELLKIKYPTEILNIFQDVGKKKIGTRMFLDKSNKVIKNMLGIKHKEKFYINMVTSKLPDAFKLFLESKIKKLLIKKEHVDKRKKFSEKEINERISFKEITEP